MREALLRNVSVSFLANGVARVGGILMTALIFRAFPKGVVGEYYVLMAYFGYATAVMQLGHGQALVRYVVSRSWERVGQIVLYRISAAIAIIFVAVMVGAFVAPLTVFHWAAVGMLFCALVPSAVSLDWLLTARRAFPRLAMVTVVAQAVAVSVTTAAYLLRSITVLVLVQMALSATLALGCLLAATRREVTQILRSARQHGSTAWSAVAAAALDNWGFSYLALLGTLAGGADMVVAGLSLSGEDLGTFAALVRLSAIAISFQLIANNVLYPHLLAGETSFRTSLGFNIVVGAVMALGMVAAPGLLAGVLFGGGYVGIDGLIRAYGGVPLAASLFYGVLVPAYVKIPNAVGLSRKVVVTTLVIAGFFVFATYTGRRFGVEGLIVLSYVKWAGLAALVMGLTPRGPLQENHGVTD